MASVTSYSALVGKTRAMYGQILRDSDYRELLSCRSVADIADYLKNNTRYRTDLEDCDTSSIHRGYLEQLLRRGLMTDYNKLAVFSQGSLRTFVHLVYKKHEIEALKLLFRAFAAGNVSQDTLENSLTFLSKYDRLNIPKLSLSRNAQEFISNLQGTEYYHFLRPYLGDSEKLSLFQIEMILDSYFYGMIAHFIDRSFTGEDKAIAKVLYGSEIDLFNLMTIFRCKVYYHMDRDVINSYWIDNHHRISEDMRSKLLAASDRETILSLLAQTPYQKVFSARDDRFFDVKVNDFLYNLHLHMFQHKVFSISSLLCYLRIREIELKNLISLIEGIRYRLPENELVRYMIGYEDEF